MLAEPTRLLRDLRVISGLERNEHLTKKGGMHMAGTLLQVRAKSKRAF
jgi:hypothetical protein